MSDRRVVCDRCGCEVAEGKAVELVEFGEDLDAVILLDAGGRLLDVLFPGELLPRAQPEGKRAKRA